MNNKNNEEMVFSTINFANYFECMLNYNEIDNILFSLYGCTDIDNYYLVFMVIGTNYRQNIFSIRTTAVKLKDNYGLIARCFCTSSTIESIMSDNLDGVLKNISKICPVVERDRIENMEKYIKYEDLFTEKEKITFDVLEQLGGKPRK